MHYVIDMPIMTGVHSSRHNSVALCSAVVIGCSGDAGMLSEIALSLTAGKTVILMGLNVARSFMSRPRVVRRLPPMP